MTKQNNQLISILIEHKTPITSNEMSEQLGISSRTVKRMIWNIDSVLKANGAAIISDKNGYRMNISNEKQFHAFWDEQLRISKQLSVSNTTVFDIIKLLLVKEYISQDELSDTLFISRSTISKYIKQVKNTLEQNQIILSNRPHYGYYLLGQETVIRNYMVKLVFPEGNLRNYNDPLVITRCRSYSDFYEAIIKELNGGGYDEQDIRTQGLIKYFIVLACRYVSNHKIEKYSDDVQISHKSRALSEKIIKIINEYFAIDLGRDELIYLSFLLGNPLDEQIVSETYDASFFEKVVDECFQEIKDVYQQDFSYDEILRKGLVSHLYTSYSRMQINAFLSNPILSMNRVYLSKII